MTQRQAACAILKASLDRVLDRRTGDAMSIQQYDIQKPATDGGGYEVRYWRPFNAPVLAPDGTVAWIIHRVEDVTESMRLKAEGREWRDAADRLRDSEQMVRAVLDSLTAHIAIVDEFGLIIQVNASWREFARENGATLTAVGEGVNCLAVCDAAAHTHSVGAAALAAAIRDVLAGRLREYAAEYPCHSGTEERWFTVHVTPCPGEAPRHAVVSHEDITPQKRAEKALEARKAQLHSFVQQAPAAIAMFDRNMNYVAFSQRWLGDYGLSHRDLTGVNHYDLFPDLPERWREVHRNALAGAPQSCDEDLVAVECESLDGCWWEYRRHHDLVGRHHLTEERRMFSASAKLICARSWTPWWTRF